MDVENSGNFREGVSDPTWWLEVDDRLRRLTRLLRPLPQRLPGRLLLPSRAGRRTRGDFRRLRRGVPPSARGPGAAVRKALHWKPGGKPH